MSLRMSWRGEQARVFHFPQPATLLQHVLKKGISFKTPGYASDGRKLKSSWIAALPHEYLL